MSMKYSQDMAQFVKEYPFPTDVLIETTRNCNLSCIMCPCSSLSRSRGDMTFELWKKIVDEIAEISPTTTIWPAIMGEPLLHPQIFEFIRYAKDKGIQRICMNTNLLPLEDADIPKLFDSQVDQIIIGIDAIRPETYEKIRVGGEFEKVMASIVKLAAARKERGSALKIVLQMIIQEENKDETQEFIDYWKAQGLGLLLKLRYRTSWGGSITPYQELITIKQEERVNPCLWLLRNMAIHWDGNVTPCDSPWPDYYGNVSEQSLLSLWEGPLKPVRERHFNRDFSAYPCNQCSDWLAGLSQMIEA